MMELVTELLQQKKRERAIVKIANTNCLILCTILSHSLCVFHKWLLSVVVVHFTKYALRG